MKKQYFLIFILISNMSVLIAQTEWTGPMIAFTKANNADWTLEANQDRITENVWITRQNQWSIFNIAQGDISSKTQCSSGHPNDTEWAFGTIADGVTNLTFSTFLNANFVNCNFGINGVNLVGMDAVLHLITDNIYIDIKFISWTSSANGGGFSYQRSTDQSLSINGFELKNKLELYPNPFNPNTTIYYTLINESVISITVYDILGKEINQLISLKQPLGEHTIQWNGTDQQSNLVPAGTYFIRYQAGNLIQTKKMLLLK